jgi:hypothetical protein
MPLRRTRALVLTTLLASLALGCSPLLYVIFHGRMSDHGGALRLGESHQGSTAQSGDNYAPQCGASDAPDVTYTFTPPTAGVYRIHVSSQYDAVLALARDGREIACNDDYQGTSASRIERELNAGETYEVVIDGYHSASGAFTVTVTRPSDEPPVAVATDAQTGATSPPPTEDPAAMEPRCRAAPRLPVGVTRGTITPTVATAVLACGGRGGDFVYRVHATEPGLLRVHEESNFDAMLELRAGCGAGHESLACNDDAGDTRHALVQAHVAPGDYYLIVDSFRANEGGEFTLTTEFTPDARVAR